MVATKFTIRTTDGIDHVYIGNFRIKLNKPIRGMLAVYGPNSCKAQIDAIYPINSIESIEYKEWK